MIVTTMTTARSSFTRWLSPAVVALAAAAIFASDLAGANPLLLCTMDLYNDADMDGVFSKEEILILQSLEQYPNENPYNMGDSVAFELRIEVSDLPLQGLNLTDLSTPNFMLPFQDVPEQQSCNGLVNENVSPGELVICYFSVSKKQVIETMGVFQKDDQQTIATGEESGQDPLQNQKALSDALTMQGDAAVFEVSAAFGWIMMITQEVLELPLLATSSVFICEYQDCANPLWTPTPAPVSASMTTPNTANSNGSGATKGLGPHCKGMEESDQVCTPAHQAKEKEEEEEEKRQFHDKTESNPRAKYDVIQDIVAVLGASSWLSGDEYDVQKMELLQFVQAAAELDQQKDQGDSNDYTGDSSSTTTTASSSCSIRMSVVQFAGQEVETSCPLACAADVAICIRNMERLSTNYLTGLRPLSFGLNSARRELQFNGKENSKKTVAVIAGFSEPTGIPSIKAEKSATHVVAETLKSMDLNIAVVQFHVHNDNSFLQSIATKPTEPDGSFSPLPPLFKLVHETEEIAEALGHLFCIPVQKSIDQGVLETGNSFSSFLNQDLGFAGHPDKIYSLVKDIGISINGKWGFPDSLMPLDSEQDQEPEISEEDNKAAQAQIATTNTTTPPFPIDPWLVEVGIELVPDAALYTSEIIQIKIDLDSPPELEQCQLTSTDCISAGSVMVNGDYYVKEGQFTLQSNYVITLVNMNAITTRVDIASPHANLAVHVRKPMCSTPAAPAKEALSAQNCPHIDLTIKSIELFPNATGIIVITADSEFEIDEDVLSDLEEPYILQPL